MLAAFKDSFRVLHPDAREVGTFNGFKYGQAGGEKIDFVFVEPGAEVLAAEIVRSSRDGRYPSDHFPVTARVRLR
jgi:endonuclease/exonuclease/phosphatase family metal-dependent hydrolase